MTDPTMDITAEEIKTVLEGISDGGKISKEASAVIKKRIKEVKPYAIGFRRLGLQFNRLGGKEFKNLQILGG